MESERRVNANGRSGVPAAGPGRETGGAPAVGAVAALAAAAAIGACGPDAEGPPDVAGGPDGAFTAVEAITAHDTASRGPRQPIAFNHRFHVGELQMGCPYCHTGTEDSDVAGLPALSVCMGCHRFVGEGLVPVEKLRGYSERGQPVPWEPVFDLPDFVQFSHRAHLRNEIECETCHGPVGEMDRVHRTTPFNMGWCLECHRGEPRPGDTATTYLLVREHHIPEIPAGREQPGLYPRRIDMSYAETRAPVDCFTCHY